MGLDDIRVKLDRAKEHLDALNADLQQFATEEPHPLHVVIPDRAYTVQDVVWMRDPPARWGALVGDCVHNLRSALDHIVWALSGGNRYAPQHAEFPIFENPFKFFERTKKGEPARGSGIWKIAGVVPDEARAIIEGLQPFNRPQPERHPLWIIHELDRFDKHRALHVIFGWAYPELWKHGIRKQADFPPGWHRIKATQSSRYPAKTPAGRKDRVKVRFDLAMRIALPPGTVGSHENLDVVLALLCDFVDTEVIGPLTPYL
jgi:hypothetical protein